VTTVKYAGYAGYAGYARYARYARYVGYTERAGARHPVHVGEGLTKMMTSVTFLGPDVADVPDVAEIGS
jgi:hypothetical protein